jgi:hypothetical protein
MQFEDTLLACLSDSRGINGFRIHQESIARYQVA